MDHTEARDREAVNDSIAGPRRYEGGESLAKSCLNVLQACVTKGDPFDPSAIVAAIKLIDRAELGVAFVTAVCSVAVSNDDMILCALEAISETGIAPTTYRNTGDAPGALNITHSPTPAVFERILKAKYWPEYEAPECG